MMALDDVLNTVISFNIFINDSEDGINSMQMKFENDTDLGNDEKAR